MEYAVSQIGSVLTCALSGRLTYRDANTFAEMQRQIDAGGPVQVVFDLCLLEYLDSVGLGMLIQAGATLGDRGAAMVVSNPVGVVRTLLEQFDLGAALEVRAAPAEIHQLAVTTTRHAEGRTVFSLVGRLNACSQQVFLPVIETIAQSPGGVFEIELSGLEHMDSIGLSMVMIAADESRRNGTRLSLVGPQRRVGEMLRLCAVDSLVPIV